MTQTVSNTNPRFCSECGSPIQTNAKFCSGCGQKIIQKKKMLVARPIPGSVGNYAQKAPVILSINNNSNDMKQPLIIKTNNNIIIEEKDREIKTNVNDTLFFQSKLPKAFTKNKLMEDKIINFLDESKGFFNKYGDVILVILTSNVSVGTFKSDDEISSIGNRIQIKRGETFKKKFINACCVSFREDPEFDTYRNKLNPFCSLTSMQICMFSNGVIDKNSFSWSQSLTSEPFDTRQLPLNIYNELINKYGKDIVIKSHLKSSEISKVDNDLIIAMKEIKSLWFKAKSRKMAQREQIDAIKRAYRAIENGANPNLVINPNNDYRTLHYAIYISGEVTAFVRFVINHGGDPQLGPIYVVEQKGEMVRYHYTPWYYYHDGKDHGVNMIKNGPLEKAIGGPAGGRIYASKLHKCAIPYKKTIVTIIIVVAIGIWAVVTQVLNK